MQRPIRPRWLLRQAKELAGEGRGQPRNADLRRSASAAYYAAFHAIAYGTAQAALPEATVDEVRQATRLVAHRSIRDVCGYVSGDKPPEHVESIVGRLRSSHEVFALAADFLKLNEAREEADYDHLADFTRPRVRALIARAEKAVLALEGETWSPDLRLFLGLVALRMRP